MSSKTQNGHPAKTASAHREGSHETPILGFSSRRAPAKPDARASLPGPLRSTAYLRLCVGGVVLLIGVTILNPISRQFMECTYYHTPVTNHMAIGNRQVATQTVITVADQEKGLSGRPCIKDNQAMVFVFGKADKSDHCFWMKDMRFAIDMVWLDSEKRVVDVVRDAQPSTYPKSLCPGRPTSYVLELKANTAQKTGLEPGTSVGF